MFDADLLHAASDPELASRLEGQLVVGAVVALATRGFAGDGGDPIRRLSLVRRVQQLLGSHSETAGGVLCPSGSDLALARFESASAAFAAVWAVVDEVEAARPADSHRHHRLLGAGVSRGPLLLAPDGSALGVPMGRAVRLAVNAERLGEVLLCEAMASEPIPEGWGLHRARADAVARVGFDHHVMGDYRG